MVGVIDHSLWSLVTHAISSYAAGRAGKYEHCSSRSSRKKDNPAENALLAHVCPFVSFRNLEIWSEMLFQPMFVHL
jgi:hypothetical protein